MNKKLFVRNLSWSVSEDDLYEVFSNIGDVISVKIPLKPEDSKPRGFAFVEMASTELAQKAIKELNGVILDERELSVDYSKEERKTHSSGNRYQNPETKTSKLFVRNISQEVSEDELEELFNQSGKVISVKIPIDRDSGYPRPFGFVEMSSVEEAKNAINDLNNVEIGGQVISVSYQNNDRKPKRPNTSFNKNRYNY